MTTLPVTIVLDSARTLLTEAYAGPPNPQSTWFIDNEANSGLFGTIDGLTAAEASEPVGEGQGEVTIASQVEHLRWSLANANAVYWDHKPWNDNWTESWQVSNLDEAGWDRLRQSVRAEFERMRDGLPTQKELPGEYLIGVMALVAHAAFHLGLVRQLVERVRAAR